MSILENTHLSTSDWILKILFLIPAIQMPLLLFSTISWIIKFPFLKFKPTRNSGIIPFIHLRYVTRGTNKIIIRENLKYMLNIINNNEVKEYADQNIEIITDNYINLDDNITQIIVPSSQITPNNSLYKARALHYASQNIKHKGWVLHLDEESIFDVNNAIRIANFVQNEIILIENGSKLSYANGIIIQTAPQILKSCLLTFADCLRVGQDQSQFRFQGQIINRPIFGMHGSFLLVHNIIEETIGFDVGKYNSVTEDTAFGALAHKYGQKLKFIEAKVYEQSPFNIKDFLKQRKRWMKGLVLNCFYMSNGLFKICMIYIVISCLLSPFTVIAFTIWLQNCIYQLINKNNAINYPLNGYENIILMYIFSAYYLLQLVGQINGGFEKYGRFRQLIGLVQFISPLGIIISSKLEIISILYQQLSFDKNIVDFHIIDKDISTKNIDFSEVEMFNKKDKNQLLNKK